MTGRTQIRDVVETLQASKATIRCQDMIGHLESLGFEVRAGGKAGHKVVLHHGIEGFYSAAFTCGHGRNPEIKPVYVTRMIRLIRQYEAELTQFLEKQS